MAKILICDDTSFMRMTIREALEKNGYEIVAEAQNGVEGVELYKKLNPDLITMDILLKTPGVEAVKK